MPINFKKLKEVIKGKPAPSSFHQTKEYGENYKSEYKAEVQPTTKRHSAPSVLVKPPPAAQPKKDHVSEYSQSQMNKDRPALAVLKKKEKDKRGSHAPRDARATLTGQEDEEEHETTPPPKKRTTPPTHIPPHVVPPTKQSPPQKAPAPQQKQQASSKPQAPPPVKQEPGASSKSPETPAKPQPPPTPVKQDEPPKKTVQPPAKQAEPPSSNQNPSPTLIERILGPAKNVLASEGKPPPPTTQETPDTLAAKQEPTPGPAAPTPAATRRATPPTPTLPQTSDHPKQTPEPKRTSVSSPPPTTQKRTSASASSPAPASPKRTSGSSPAPTNQKRISAGGQPPQQKEPQSAKRTSNPPTQEEVAKSNPDTGKSSSRELPPLPTSSELRKKPPEVSGYFAADPREAEKRFYNLPTQFFFDKKKRQSGGGEGEDGEEDEFSSSKPKKQQAKRGTVKFNEGLPKQRFSLREGSMHLMEVTVHDLPSPLASDFEYDKYSTGSEDDEDFDLNFKDHLRSSFSIFPSDSLASIRRNPRVVKPETEQEYCGHRKHFWEAFLIFIIFFVTYIFLTVYFIFHYNYGLSPASPPANLSANVTLYKHEWSRVYTNYHMLIMILPRNELLGISIQMYRLFPCITITNMKFVHGFLSMLATVATGAGLYCCVQGKIVSDGMHLYSLHSFFGITSVVSTLCSILTGLSAGLPIFSWETRVSTIPIHRQLANFVFMSDTASILTGLVQVSRAFFNSAQFPTLYFKPYYVVHDRSVVLNMIAILCLFFVAMPLYITSNYNFRRRREPLAKELKDPDQEQKEKVMTARRSRAKIFEAHETEREGGDDVQIGSRKSFNLKNKGVWKGLHHKGKSIALLINENEKRKANFTDTDLLLSLE